MTPTDLRAVLELLPAPVSEIQQLGGPGRPWSVRYGARRAVLRRNDPGRFRDFGQWKLSWMGLASNQKLEHYPRKYLGVTTFEQLRIPLAIAATDLATGEPVYFTQGPLGPALRASCAYPGMFMPVEHEGRLLVDGFLAAPVPVDALKNMGADVVIAVFLEAASDRKPSSIVDVIGLSFAILQRHADREWRRKADIVIEPIVRDFLWDDFDKTPELIASGEAAARAALPKIRAALVPKSAQATTIVSSR